MIVPPRLSHVLARAPLDHRPAMASRLFRRSTAEGGDPTSQPIRDPSVMPYTAGLSGVDLHMNDVFTYALVFSLVAVCLIILFGRFAQFGDAHLRHLFSLSATREQQSFWSRNRSSLWPNVKRHLLYAPLGKKRHNREMQLSSAINIGTLPSRFHATLLVLYVVCNIAYCAALDYGQPRARTIAELRGRSGSLAVVNMVPLFVLAGRNNPLIRLLRVSFDTYNLLHRWMGRIVVAEALVHTAAWAANQISASGFGLIAEKLRTNTFVQYGCVGTFTMTFMLLHSPSAIRHAFYETFLHLHQAAALAAVVGVYQHVHMHKLPQMPYIKAVIALWAFDRVVRFGRVFYRSWSWREGFSNVTVEALPGEASRVTIDIRRPWRFKPGTHVFVYLPAISYHQSHPFSVAWAEMGTATAPPSSSSSSSSSSSRPSDEESVTDEKSAGGGKGQPDLPSQARSTISLVVHRRTGMTAKLYDRAAAAPDGRITFKGAVEGPYGALGTLDSYGTVVLFAGGIGITHQVSHVRDLIAGYGDGTVATRKVVLVWTVRSTEHLEWVRPWMDTILQMPGRRDILKILLFITKPKSPREVISPSATVQMYPGRPQPQVIIDKEIDERVGAMAVTVCGPGALADAVRHAARKRVDVANLDFVEEAFSW